MSKHSQENNYNKCCFMLSRLDSSIKPILLTAIFVMMKSLRLPCFAKIVFIMFEIGMVINAFGGVYRSSQNVFISGSTFILESTMFIAISSFSIASILCYFFSLISIYLVPTSLTKHEL